jgi:hypothetical protein
LDWFPANSTSSSRTIFYSQVGDVECNPSIRFNPDTENSSSTTLILRPKLYSGNTPPSANLPGQRENDMYVNTANGDMYQSVSVYDYSTTPATVAIEWKKVNGVVTPKYNIYSKYPQLNRDKPITIIDANGESITNKIFKDSGDNVIQGYIILYNDLYTGFKVFVQEGTEGNCCKQVESVSEDSSGNQLVLSATPVPNSPKPDQTVWSGSKFVVKNNLLLFSGIALLIIGVIGSIVGIVIYIKSNRKPDTIQVFQGENGKEDIKQKAKNAN